jgi:hypothetical protein
VASCLKRKCYLEWGTLTFYPNIYVVLVGPSGCRKGTAMGPGFNMLQEIGIRMAAEATTRESLIRELKTSSDTTLNPESGSMIMHSSLTIYSQELTVFLGYNNMQLISDLTDWYDCRTKWIYRTKNSGTDDITGVWVNLFGATTPALLQTTLPSDAIGGGLTSRIIFVYEAKKGKIVPIPFLTEEQQELRPRLMHDLENIHMLSGQYRYSADFIDHYMIWYLKQEENPPFTDERLAGYLERRANHVLKLCMILSASRANELYLTPHDLYRAIEILRLAEVNMPRVFAGIGHAQHAAVMSRIIAALEIAGEMSNQEILSRFAHDIDSWGLSKVMETVCATGAATLHRIGTQSVYRARRPKGND